MTASRPEQDALWLERLQAEGAPALTSAEAARLAAALQPSIVLLRDGSYWAAHETLEDLWRQTPYPERLFPYALIKVAVGLLHVERGNRAAAQRQLAQAAACLRPFTPRYGGVDTAAVARQVQTQLAALAAGGATGAPFDFPAAVDDGGAGRG